jgi:D-glycero-alpha-D-manno-heptose-7-phosphate kinase
MIVTKTPLRVSFFGGGSDLPEYFMNSPGAVLSTAIDVNMFITINESPRKRIKACYDEIEIVDTTAYLNHSRIRETLLHYGIHSNLEVASFCHIPTKGTGLGSSSSYTVGLCNAVCEYLKQPRTKFDLAETAYFIERVRCNEKLGMQDQYAAAFGGINLIEFYSNDVQVIPINISIDNLRTLQNNLMFFYTGVKRVANDILEKQAEKSQNDDTTKLHLKRLVELSYDGAKVLSKSSRINEIGSMLDYAWSTKRQLLNTISNEAIDTYYHDAMCAGALGGKLLGAGGGGFLMFYVPRNKQQNVREALSVLQEYKFNISHKGSEVVLNDR